MDEKIMQIQSLKLQIDNIKCQLDNIELQYKNNIQMGMTNLLNESLIGEQLLNLSIQLLNSGISSFNIGKKLNIEYEDYNEKLNKIIEQINLLTNENNIQPLLMMPPPLMLNNQSQMFDYNYNYKNSIQKKNIVFDDRSGEIINIQVENGTTIAELLEQYFDRLYNQNINNINYKIKFLYDGKTLEMYDQRKIEEVFKSNIANIWALKI